MNSTHSNISSDTFNIRSYVNEHYVANWELEGSPDIRDENLTCCHFNDRFIAGGQRGIKGMSPGSAILSPSQITSQITFFFFRPHRLFFLFPPVQCLVPDYPLMQEHFLWPLLKRKVLHWGWISVCGCFNLSFKFLLDLDNWERFSSVRECDDFLQRVFLRWAQLTDLQIQV